MTLSEIIYLLDEVNVVIQDSVDAIGTIISTIVILYYLFIKKFVIIFKGGYMERLPSVAELF